MVLFRTGDQMVLNKNHVQSTSDEQLASRVMAGDRSALAVLVERYYGPLLGYLYRLVDGDRPLAEDLVQETFVRLLRQDSYQPDRPFKPWLYAIATNLVRDHFRSPASRQTVSIEDEVQPELNDPSPDPEELAQAVEQGRWIMLTIRRLGPEYRTVLILRFYQGLSLQEIAETLSLPLGTVKSRLSVGTHRLRDLLISTTDEVHG